jgi:2-phospho-L-lactate/phosphoenolpyruvate guanylyltransferase
VVTDADPGRAPGWVLILPLKGGDSAKSRLGGGPELARAIALDCLDAVLACPDVRQVLVVTADPGTAADADAAGSGQGDRRGSDLPTAHPTGRAQPPALAVVPESRPGSGLVAAVRDGLAAAPAPPRDGPAAVLLGDLPALRPAELSAGLAAAAAALAAHPHAPMAALADAEGTGTVLLAGRAAGDLDPAFGPGSLAEHRRRGAVPVVLDDPGPRDTDPARLRHDTDPARLRHDVDTPADLSVALALGVGPRTAALLAAARPAS